MDSELMKWVFGVGFTGLGAIITAIISWIRTSKMIPKELESMNLENRQKEVSLVEQYDTIVDMAVARAVNSEERFCKLEGENKTLREDIKLLGKQLDEQKELIKEQAKTIALQTSRLNSQGIRIQEQEELIGSLRMDLTSAQEYSNQLMLQLKEKNITPKENPKRRTSRASSQTKDENNSE
jgi:hypothetical protein